MIDSMISAVFMDNSNYNR